MTDNELILQALQLVHDELGNIVESLAFKKELDRLGGGIPAAVIDAATAMFEAQRTMVKGYIDHVGTQIAKESGL